MIERIFDSLWQLNVGFTRFTMRFMGERSRRLVEAYLREQESGRQKRQAIDRHYALVREFQREYYDDFLISDWFSAADADELRKPEYFHDALEASNLAESHAFEHFLTIKRAKHANSPEHLAALETFASTKGKTRSL